MEELKEFKTKIEKFEKAAYPSTEEHLDDSGLVIKTENGLIVFSGCSHSGICNTVEYAKKITGDNRVLAVMGGFHLKAVDECTTKTIEYMKQNNVQMVYLAHCTSDIVCQEFIKQMSDGATVIETGKEYNFKDKAMEIEI